MKDAISYIRVSSEEQADSGLGLEAQRQRIASYCAMKGLHLAEEFEDPGVSAGKPLASRPANSGQIVRGTSGSVTNLLYSRKQQTDQDTDDGNDYEQFDKC